MFDFSFVTEHMGPSVWRGGCPWDRCAGWTCTLSVQMDRLVCSCLLQPRWRTHASTSRTDKHLGGRRFQRVFAKRRSLLGCSSRIRTWSIANTSWWMNWGGRHVCVKMPSYYRSNRTNRWSWLKVTLISFWLSITGSALFVMAGSTISIPMLLFGEHDRAALLWLTRWRITLLFCSSVYYFPFLLANLHPCTQWGNPTCVIWCNLKNCLHIFIHCRVQQLEVIISLSSFFLCFFLLIYALRVFWTREQCLSCLITALIVHLRVRLVSGLLPALTAETLGRTHQTSGRDQGANSYGLTCTTIGGFPKGSVWLSAIWLNPVLRNPQPTPSACRPRCVAPARPVPPSSTTVVLSFMGFYSLRHPFPCSILQPYSMGVQIRKI